MLAVATTAAADTYPRQPGVDAWHYVFRLELNDASPEIAGEATVDLLIVKDGVAEARLDLTSVASNAGITVTSVTSGGQPARFIHAANVLTLPLPAGAKAGEHVRFAISYHGVPAQGLRLIKNKYGEWSAFSENWPNRARQWLPMIDHPYDKATSEFIVTAPSRYRVVANGLLIEETDLGDGRRTTHWKQSVPIASWLNALGVEQFYVHHAGVVKGVELTTWVAHQDADAGPLYFETPARQALDFYSEHVGPYAYEKLANVAAAGLNGGTEHASAIFYGERAVRPAPATSLVAHEIAHQWFGDAVTESDWDDVFLSEGFATYFTHLFTEHYAGRDAMVEGLKRDKTTVFTYEKANPAQAIVHRNLDDMSKVLNRLVYQKAGWVLHMLRGQIGTDAFWRGIREYYARYRNLNASRADFARVMEEASGQDLRWFFAQWLMRPGSPVVRGSWRYDEAAKRIEIALEQSQAGDEYRLPLEIGVAAGGPMRIERIVMAARSGHFNIGSDTRPTAVVLDPNTWTLMDATFSEAAR